MNDVPSHQVGRILLCTNHMFRWTGSEVVLLELAEELASRCIDVHVFANEVSGELRDALSACGVTICENVNDVDLFSYDLVYSQHHVLPLLLENALKIDAAETTTFPVFVYNHLSSFDPLEVPGPFIEGEIADIIFANSAETAAKIMTYGLSFQGIEVFANPAPRQFGLIETPPNPTMQRLLVVSNHMPPELVEALKMLAKSGVHVTRVGRKYMKLRVSSELLASHDAVVSIGKTAQYALRAKRPIFCYDHFAGPGWIKSKKSFDAAKHYNFSGRDHNHPRTAQALAEEIEAGYSDARDYCANIPVDDQADISLELQVDALLARGAGLLADPKRNLEKWSKWQSPRMQQIVRHEAAMAAVIRREFRGRRSTRKKENKKHFLPIFKGFLNKIRARS